MLWYSESEFKKSICTFQSIGFIHDPLELKLHLFITLAISFKSPYLLCILRGENNSPPEKRNWQKHAWKHGGGWAKNCKRILSSFGEIQATFQWSSRHAQYGHKQWQAYFGRTFDIYTKLWKFQQQHRPILDRFTYFVPTKLF